MSEGIVLKLTYSEMDLLREVVKKKQYNIWIESWASRIIKGVPINEMEELFEKIMNNETLTPIDDRGCCYTILKKFEILEREIQQELKEIQQGLYTDEANEQAPS